MDRRFSVSEDELKERGLCLVEYLVLWSVYNHVLIKYLSELPDSVYDALIAKGLIKKKDEWYIPTEDGSSIFEPSDGTFEEFIESFPTRAVNTITGEVRVLSPASPTSALAKKLRKKWYAITKKDKKIQEHIINCLKCEVDLRKKTNSLHYMRNIETWINKATWEDYEYLLRENKSENVGRVNEIKL